VACVLVSTTEIQNSFGKYLKLSQCEEIIITKNGKKVAKLISYQANEERDPWIPNESSPTYAPNGIRLTYEEFLKLTEESENRYEYIDGELYLLASPFYPHQKAVKEIFGHFIMWFQGKECEPLVSPFDVTLFRLEKEEKINVVQPDILVICDHDKIDEKGRYKGTPTLVVEVLSDSTKSKDLIKKLDLYQESGIKEYWVVNPSASEIYIYTFINDTIDKLRTFKGDEKAESIIFPGLAVELRQVFS
jgi:prevent-host-death family protein